MSLAVADAVWKEIKSSRSVTDDHLSILHFLFGRNFERAARIVDEGGVRKISAVPSGRSLFVCKHQLAAQLAEAVEAYVESDVSDEELALMLSRI
ncbi:hypothetical protein QJS04_geneDACA001667 [Acorus gramineus]|uniref:Uncharacterized protein n=1 Tax=Acorus gramineus TaxID=55184 RepID=A0AAV9BH04_ACOGR|nr:hypothetical protein QJS04_geneDACA001667 [Acorus gramineus]